MEGGQEGHAHDAKERKEDGSSGQWHPVYETREPKAPFHAVAEALVHREVGIPNRIKNVVATVDSLVTAMGPVTRFHEGARRQHAAQLCVQREEGVNHDDGMGQEGGQTRGRVDQGGNRDIAGLDERADHLEVLRGDEEGG